MASGPYRPGASQPITRKGRIILSLFALLAAFIVGIAVGNALYQANRDLFRQSGVLGQLLCGTGLRVDDVTSDRGSRRMVCLDQTGAEVGPRNNFVAIKIGLPFFVLVAMPLLWLAWTLDLASRRRSR